VAFFLREEQMKRRLWLVAALIGMGSLAGSAIAHFGMVIPADNMVMQGEAREIRLVLSFSHPMEMVGMDMAKPQRFSVSTDGRVEDLLNGLVETTVMDRGAWAVDYRLKRPGGYVFWMEPNAYWEPAEDAYIVHYTKTVVAAFGDDEGWDTELGLKTEIVPLSKPFGLYAGNTFQGIVKMDGVPVPYSDVEIEFYNEDKSAAAPTDYMVTQSVKADGNGVFTYSVPAPGWWGFAALNTADFKLKAGGEDKDVELGAVIWVKFEPWSTP
jgi:cobalt/nickel transport protein